MLCNFKKPCCILRKLQSVFIFNSYYYKMLTCTILYHFISLARHHDFKMQNILHHFKCQDATIKGYVNMYNVKYITLFHDKANVQLTTFKDSMLFTISTCIINLKCDNLLQIQVVNKKIMILKMQMYFLRQGPLKPKF